MHPRVVRRAACWSLTFLFGGACARPEAAAPRDSAASVTAEPATAVDDFGAPLPTDARFAARVVSLNPAATEVIFAIGADSSLVGRSKWDVFPQAAARVPALGDGIRPNIEAVLATRPTLVVLYATADNRPAADAFARAGVRTLAVRVDRIAHFEMLVRTLGVALGAEARARTVADSVTGTLARVRETVDRLVPAAARPRVVWPAWLTPPMVIGGGSYLDELLTIAGAVNVFHDHPAPSPTIGMEEIVARAPDVVVTSEARAATLRTTALWQGLPAVKAGRFVLDDPNVAGRPSVVLGMAAVQLARALHPAIADSIR